MDFETEIEYDGCVYVLDVKTHWPDPPGDEPAEIYVDIIIKKRVGEETYYADTLSLLYTVRTRMYTPVIERDDLDNQLYALILQALDDEYGDKWGYSPN